MTMTSLDWQNSDVQLKTEPHSKFQTRLQLALNPDELHLLHEALSQIANKQGTELRLGLPGKWTIYFKLRPASSRVQLAHPQADEWVATLSLCYEHFALFLNSLREVTAHSPPTSLSQFGNPGPFANFELAIRARDNDS